MASQTNVPMLALVELGRRRRLGRSSGQLVAAWETSQTSMPVPTQESGRVFAPRETCQTSM